MTRSLVISPKVVIPGRELSFSFVRSSGPGGQNVNKVNSKALLRWNVAASTSVPQDVKSRFCERFAGRINQSGEVVLSSDTHRDQHRNVSECRERLRHLIQAVLEPPRRRTKTRPTRGSIERRLTNKRIRSQTKRERQFRPGSEG